MSKSINIHIWTLTLMATVLLASPAWAGLLLDPTTLHIGPGANTPCATGGCPIFTSGPLYGELNSIASVNNISTTELDIYQNQSNAATLYNPVLLILSVPNNISVPSALSASLYSPYPEPNPGPANPTSVAITPGANVYGITTQASGYFGSMTSSDVYSLLGITGAPNSNSFKNYSTAYLETMGTSVSSFGIYLFSIDTANFGGNDLLDIQLNALPEGTFAIAYGENATHFFDTPFTEAGLVDKPPMVPEPSSLSLFGAALLALGLLRWRKRRFI